MKASFTGPCELLCWVSGNPVVSCNGHGKRSSHSTHYFFFGLEVHMVYLLQEQSEPVVRKEVMVAREDL